MIANHILQTQENMLVRFRLQQISQQLLIFFNRKWKAETTIPTKCEKKRKMWLTKTSTLWGWTQLSGQGTSRSRLFEGILSPSFGFEDWAVLCRCCTEAMKPLFHLKAQRCLQLSELLRVRLKPLGPVNFSFSFPCIQSFTKKPNLEWKIRIHGTDKGVRLRDILSSHTKTEKSSDARTKYYNLLQHHQTLV